MWSQCQSGHVSRAEQTIYSLGNLIAVQPDTISEGFHGGIISRPLSLNQGSVVPSQLGVVESSNPFIFLDLSQSKDTDPGY